MPRRGLPPPRYADIVLRIIEAYSKRLGDALYLYRALPNGLSFHEAQDYIRLLIGSNQAGKTLCAAADFAMLARRMHPFRNHDHRKTLKMLMVGKDNDHIGEVMWAKLSMPGAFEIVPDEVTGFWRSVRPDPTNPRVTDPIDLMRKHLWRPAPPLIPPSAIKRISYDKKSENIPSMIVVHGFDDYYAEILCHSSLGAPRNGIQLDEGWFDEEIENKKWFSEIFPRLVRMEGRMSYSFTPQASTPEAYKLHNRFLRGEPGIGEFTLLIDDNPFFTPEAKQRLYNDLAALGDDELAVRWYAQFAIAGRKCYPTYSLEEHGVEAFEPPDHWMRILVVDPGTAAASALFMAVPPAANELHVYRSLVMRNKSAKEMAREVKNVLGGHTCETWVMDKRGGIQRSMGRANRVCDHYTEEFKKAGVLPSRMSGHAFAYGNDIPEARELSVKALLQSKKLKIHRQVNHLLDQQIQNRFYSKNNPTKRETRTEHDLCDCLEYGCSYFDSTGLYYHAPAPVLVNYRASDHAAYQALENKRSREKRAQSRSFRLGA